MLKESTQEGDNGRYTYSLALHMKLLFIAPSAYLLGGVQDWLYMTVLELRRRGHTVNVGIPNGHFHNGRDYNSKYHELNADYFRNASGTNLGRVRGLGRFIKKRKPDIVVGVNIGNIYAAVEEIKKTEDIKLAITNHAIEANYFYDINQYTSVIDGVITTNRLAERLAVQFSMIEKNRVYYAPYGITLRGSSIRVEGDLSTIRIAWVGRIEDKQKRVSDLIGILDSLDIMNLDYRLTIAGDGPAKKEMMNRLSERIQDNRVSFLGMVGKSELQDVYRQQDILLITSEWETGPIVAWEAIDSGLSIVSSEYIGSHSEAALIDGRTALLFKVGDTEGAAKRIKEITDGGLRRRIHNNANIMISQRYSTKTSVDAWERAFQEIMLSEKTPSPWEGSEINKKADHAGKIEKYLGTEWSEVLRSVLPKRMPNDAGSEWPHSLQGIHNQSSILEYASEIEGIS